MYVYFMSVYICMQIVSNGNAVNYRWLLIFPPDLAKKTQVWTLSKHSMINCIWKKRYEVYLWTTTFYMKKHSKINTMTTRTTNGCGYSSHVVTVDLVPSRANPPGGANMLQPHDKLPSKMRWFSERVCGLWPRWDRDFAPPCRHLWLPIIVWSKLS